MVKWQSRWQRARRACKCKPRNDLRAHPKELNLFRSASPSAVEMQCSLQKRKLDPAHCAFRQAPLAVIQRSSPCPTPPAKHSFKLLWYRLRNSDSVVMTASDAPSAKAATHTTADLPPLLHVDDTASSEASTSASMTKSDTLYDLTRQPQGTTT